ncbi:nickel/cobalt exporter [Streptacidiphilus sp. MAP5-52]
MIVYRGPVNTLPALLLAAGGVGFGHAVMPDHWLPLAVLSRTRRYRTGRVVRLSLAAALTHVLVSLLLGAVLVVVGLQFRTTVARHTDLVVGGVLLVTGAVFLVLDLLGKGHGHSHDGDGGHSQGHGRGHGHTHDHGHAPDHDGRHTHAVGTTAVLDRPKAEHEHSHPQRSPRGLAGLLIPFGAAASPDLTILPVFLAAGALGATAAVGSLVVFTLVTIGTIVGLTVAAALGARMLTTPWIDKRANMLTAVTLLVIGALVALGWI